MGTCIYRSVYEKPTSRMEVRGVEALGVCVCVSVSSVLFLSPCGPWCQKTLILS